MTNEQKPQFSGFYPGQQGESYPKQKPDVPYPRDNFSQAYPPPPAPGLIVEGSSYVEDPVQDEFKNSAFDFDDKTIRRGFVKKVYSILMVQLAITCVIMAFIMFHEPTKLFVRNNVWIYIAALITTFVLVIVLVCCNDLRRRAPSNYILLIVFTVAEGIALGAVATVHDINEVIIAVSATAVVCLALTIFAFQTKIDFTGLSAALFIASVVLLLFGIISIFYRGRTMHLVYCGLAVLLFSMYLIYDTQLMMGGKHKYSLSPEEYIFAALNLYLDIINIFIAILGLTRG